MRDLKKRVWGVKYDCLSELNQLIHQQKEDTMRKSLLALLAAVFTGCTSGPSSGDLPVVEQFEPEKYLGHWYEVARLPHSFERGMKETEAYYAMKDNDTICVVNSGKKNGEPRSVVGVACFKYIPQIGWLRVSFFRPFYGDYKIVRLAEDYSWAVITSGTKDYFWILARTTSLPDETMRDLVEWAERAGFHTEAFEYPWGQCHTNVEIPQS